MLGPFLDILAQRFSYFVPFERVFSFWYLTIFLILLVALAVRARSDWVPSINKSRDIMLSFGLIAAAILLIFQFSPFTDSLDGRGLDYRLAAKYYAEDQTYQLCTEGSVNRCFAKTQMEKAPLYPYLLSLIYLSIGQQEMTAIYLNIIISALGAGVFFFTLRVLSRHLLPAILGASLYVLSAGFLQYAGQSTVLPLTAFFILLVLFFTAQYLHHRTPDLLLLTLAVYLALGYTRIEYIFLGVVFIVLNKDAIGRLFLVDRYHAAIMWILVFLAGTLLLHTIVEIPFHTSSEGELLDYSSFSERLFELLGLLLFEKWGWTLLVFLWLALWRTSLRHQDVRNYALLHLLVYSVQILLFQAGGTLHYGIVLLPSLFLLVALGMDDAISLSPKRKRAIASSAVLILALLFLWQTAPPERYTLGDYSTEHLDAVLGSISDDAVILTPRQPLTSASLHDTQHTAALAADQAEASHTLDEAGGKPVYILHIDKPGYRDPRAFLPVDSTAEVTSSGHLVLYHFSD